MKLQTHLFIFSVAVLLLSSSFLTMMVAVVVAQQDSFSMSGSGGGMPPGIPPIYGSPELFGNLRMSPELNFWPNTPVPDACPDWAKDEWGIPDHIYFSAEALNPAQVKSMWNQYNLSPKISSQFSIDAFMNAITGVTPIADEDVNQTVQIEYLDMKEIVVATQLWQEYGVGNTPQCITTDYVEPTIPPMPTDITPYTQGTPYVEPSDPPMPTEPEFTGEPSGNPIPTYETGSLVMMIDPSKFPDDTSGQEDYHVFLNNLQQVVGFDTSTLHIHNDIWDSTQKIISNATTAQGKILIALDSSTLNSLGVIYIRLIDDNNNIPSDNYVPETDYNRLINITASFERANPLPKTCPAYLTNDTLLAQLANSKYPLIDSIPYFSDTYGHEFDGWNTTCLYQFWQMSAGQDPSCPADFGNVFPTLPAGSGSSSMPGSMSSDMPSGGSMSSDMPSGGSMSSDMPSSGSSDMPSGGSMSSDMPSGGSMSSDMPSSGSSDMPSGMDSSDMPSGMDSSDMPSGMDSSDMPSDDSNSDLSPSDFIPGASQSEDPSGGIPTTPEDILQCKVPFHEYASCVLAQNTLGIVLYLRDAKSSLPECFCEGKDCVTPEPSTLFPEVTANSNGSFDPGEHSGLPPINTIPNETMPTDFDNMSFPPIPTDEHGSMDPASDPFDSIIQSMDNEIQSIINESKMADSGSGSMDSEHPSTTTAGGITNGPAPTTAAPTPGQTTAAPTPVPPGETTVAPTPVPPGETTVAPTPVPPGQTTTLSPPTTTTTTTAAPPTTTTTSINQLPNSAEFVKGPNFNMTNFKNNLASVLVTSANNINIIQDPTNASLVKAVFNTGDRNTDYNLAQKAGNLTPAQLNSIGTSSSSMNNAAANDSPTSASSPSDDKKNNTGMIAGIAIAAIAIISAVAFFLWNRNRNASRAAADNDGVVALDGYVAHQDFSDFNKNAVSERELGNLNQEHGMHAV